MLWGMSCSKCEPRARSRRWLWWIGLAVLVAAAAWFDHSSRQARALDSEAASAAPVALA
jgi:MYXO-CTERM domain-containing protein